MRRAFFALFVALVSTCALALGGSVAGATTVPSGFDQSQVGQNTNKTDQQSRATAETDQWNLNVPISVLSPGANSGDVDQSNRSDTSVFSFNENRSTQGIDQVQQGHVSGWGDHGPQGLDQSQQAANSNETSQDSSAEATTKQANVNVPIAILSPGANSGDVDQSNRAETEVGSGNSNSSHQASTKPRRDRSTTRVTSRAATRAAVTTSARTRRGGRTTAASRTVPTRATTRASTAGAPRNPAPGRT